MTIVAIPDIVVLEAVDVRLELPLVDVHVRYEEYVPHAIHATTPPHVKKLNLISDLEVQ